MGRIIHDYPIYEMENKHVPNHQSDIILYPHDIPSDFLRPNNIVPWPHWTNGEALHNSTQHETPAPEAYKQNHSEPIVGWTTY